MDEEKRNFHDIALRSILFKGRSDWYFCYLKAEKIAHVLTLLSQGSSLKDKEILQELVSAASRLPHMVAHFVAGEVDGALVLADIFSLISLTRLSATQGYLRSENAAILAGEYEDMVRKIAAENHPSPFVTSQDFVVEEMPQHKELASLSQSLGTQQRPAGGPLSIRDKYKGHKKDTGTHSKGQEERAALIYDFVKKNKGVSIKEIAAVVRGCSEKTIQRELAGLIRQGLVERRGEKRWSLYLPTPSLN